jgi:hypothetical protein
MTDQNPQDPEIPPAEIANLLNSPKVDDQKRGYDAFLLSTHWTEGQTVENLRDLVCKQFHLNTGDVKVTYMAVEPAMCFASQDTLQADKMRMVEAAYAYLQKNNLKMPPPVIWRMFDEDLKYIVHDGHHRVYFAFHYRYRLKCAVLDPLGSTAQVEQRLKYAYLIRTRVIDLPIIRHGCVDKIQ